MVLLKKINQTYIFATDSLAENQSGNVSAMMHRNLVHQKKFIKFSPNFFILSC